MKKIASLVLILVISSIAEASGPQYAITALPSPEGSTADLPGAFSPGGVVGEAFAGDYNQANGDWQPAIWQSSQALFLPTLPGYEGSARAVNASGTAVGILSTENPPYQSVPVVWTNGQLQLLDTQGSPVGYALGINDQGTISGALGQENLTHPVLWTGGQVTNLGQPQGTTNGSAQAINAVGQVLVTANTGTTATTWIWSGGTYSQIPSIGVSGVYGTAFNNVGQVIGVATLSEDSYGVGFLYSGGITAPLATPANDTYNEPGAINDDGQIVGIGSDVVHGPRALLWENGQVFDLNTLLPANSGWILEAATGIDDAGEIVGYGQFDGQTSAFELTPVSSSSAAIPEPTSLALLLLGSTLLLKRRRK